VRNRIYRQVFDRAWVAQGLANLRPYGELLEVWVASKRLDESRLLRGQALQDAKAWAKGKQLDELDYEFFDACQELEQRDIQNRLVAEESARLLLEEANKAANLKIESANRQIENNKKNQEKALAEARKNAQQEIRKGYIILGFTAIAAVVISALSFWGLYITQNELKKMKANLRDVRTFSSGETQRLQGNYQDALNTFNSVLKLNSDNSFALASRGETYRQQKRFNQALIDLKKALYLDPESSFIYASLAATYRDQGQYQLAISNFHKAIGLDDKYKWAYANLGETYRLMNEYNRPVRNINGVKERW
jgi:tetratricopeptide (TPR) repeat protein